MISYQDLGYEKVFVSLDGSESQGEVLRRAIIVAANNHADLVISHVIDTSTLDSTGQGNVPESLITEVESNFMQSIRTQMQDAEDMPEIKSVTVIIRQGHIRETIKEVIDEVEPDIVLCGARGLSSIKYALLGSISTYLLRNVECDILVVKK